MNKLIKELKREQDLLENIKELEAKKNDIDFITAYEKKITQINASKLDSQKKVKFLLKENQKLESEIDLVNDVKNYSPKNIHIPRLKYDLGEATVNMIWSDWHCDEIVKSENVQGFNEFNLDVCTDRARLLSQKVIQLVDIERNGADIKRAVIYLVGDFHAGYIHDELIASSVSTPAEGILFVQDLLKSCIDYVYTNGKFENITIICHPGNHSRFTNGKIHYKDQSKKTFEWILYHQLANIFKDNKTIDFIIPESDMYVNNQYSFLIRSQHGHNFKFNGGVGGPTISINKKLWRWNKKQPVYLDVFGHLHSYEAMRNYICNGSLIGYSEFGQAGAFEYQPPIQALFVIHKKHGLVVNRPIYL